MSKPFIKSREAREFYFFIRHIGIRPTDYAELTPLQKKVLVTQWNIEVEEQEKERKEQERKSKRGRGRKTG